MEKTVMVEGVAGFHKAEVRGAKLAYNHRDCGGVPFRHWLAVGVCAGDLTLLPGY